MERRDDFVVMDSRNVNAGDQEKEAARDTAVADTDWIDKCVDHAFGGTVEPRR